MTQSVEERLVACAHRPAGFDYLRIGLASAVIGVHTIDVCYGPSLSLQVWQSSWRPVMAVILPMFFALSGFLVAGSLERCRSMFSFLGLRVLRLAPALAVDTLVAALLIGPIFTTFTLDRYFASNLVPHYFLNILGDVHYRLPGVFLDNPWADVVNAQLWTLPYELVCYAALTVLAIGGFVRKRWAFTVALSLMWGAGLFIFIPIAITQAHSVTTAMPPVLVECFLAGVAIYLYRDRMAWGVIPGVTSIVLSLGLLTHPVGYLLAPGPIAYATVCLGLMNPPRSWIVSSGDYSYGMFLYGFPIQQAAAALFGTQLWVLNLAVAYPATLAIAILSWRYVEKPALKLRVQLTAIESFLIRHVGRQPVGRYLFQPPLAAMS